MQLRKVKDVARLLNTSERTILYKISRNEIPAIRIGRLVRVDMSKLFEVMGIPNPYQSDHLETDGAEVFTLGTP